MASFSRQFSPASPVVAIAAQPSYQASPGISSYAHQHTSITAQTSTKPPHLITSTVCRKRSRNEASIDLEPDAPPSLVHDSRENWVYGEGMVLIKPDTKYVAGASSQSGTWLEEMDAKEQEACLEFTDRLDKRSHKSQRIYQSECMPALSALSKETSIMSGIIGRPSNYAMDPIIDHFTRQLGIGWKGIADEEHIQAAARGWARFIENHYPLSDVRIRLESKGLQSYLIEATEGFFLFAEDLRQARFVSQTATGALQNLQASPPCFDGADTLLRAKSPQPSEVSDGTLLRDTDMNWE